MFFFLSATHFLLLAWKTTGQDYNDLFLLQGRRLNLYHISTLHLPLLSGYCRSNLGKNYAMTVHFEIILCLFDHSSQLLQVISLVWP
jgi:hypothetical protein